MQEAVGTAMHSAWCHMPTAASVTEHGAPEVGCWGSAQDLSSLVRAQVTMHSPLPWPATAYGSSCGTQEPGRWGHPERLLAFEGSDHLTKLLERVATARAPAVPGEAVWGRGTGA